MTQLAVGFAETAVWIAIIWWLAARRGQRPSSFGFSTSRLGRSLIAGAVVAAIFIAGTAALGLVMNGRLETPQPAWFYWGIPYYLIIIGFTEELIWRGFVTPRLAAQFSHRWIGVTLAGLLFGLSHLPFRYALDPLPLPEFLAANWWAVVIPMAWHFVLWWLYQRWNSLAAPTLMHLAMNWSNLLL